MMTPQPTEGSTVIRGQFCGRRPDAMAARHGGGHRPRIAGPLLITLAALLLLPPRTAPAGPAAAGPDAATWPDLKLDLHAALDAGRAAADALLATSIGVASPGGAVSYRQSYSFGAGDILAMPAEHPPHRLGVLHRREQLTLRLPALAGAPLTVAVDSEIRDVWTVTGEARERRQQAALAWSPGEVTLDLRWSGPQQAIDPALGLDCPLRAGLDLTLAATGAAAPSDGGSALRLVARRCEVAPGAPAYEGLATSTFEMTRSWRSPGLESDAALLWIAPGATAGTGTLPAPLVSSRELRLRHRRQRGPWETSVQLFLRQTAAGGGRGPAAAAASDPGPATRWAAHSAVRREFPLTTVSAAWQRRATPHWYLPGERPIREEFSLGVELSRLLRAVAPVLAPRLDLRWQWWRTQHVRPPATPAVAPPDASDHQLELTVALQW